MFEVKPYKRNWSVWRGDDLIVVTVYKRGALAVVALLSQLTAKQEDSP